MIKKEKGKIENMDIFNVLTMIGGLCLFLFGMNLMGQALERRAGDKLRSLLDRMTSGVFAGFLTGLCIGSGAYRPRGARAPDP